MCVHVYKHIHIAYYTYKIYIYNLLEVNYKLFLYLKIVVVILLSANSVLKPASFCSEMEVVYPLCIGHDLLRPQCTLVSTMNASIVMGNLPWTLSTGI
jgi:hypothetical protein